MEATSSLVLSIYLLPINPFKRRGGWGVGAIPALAEITSHQSLTDRQPTIDIHIYTCGLSMRSNTRPEIVIGQRPGL